MTGSKFFFASKGVMGGLIAILPPVLSLFGLSLSTGDAASIGGYINEIVTAIGGLLAIYGRVTATKRIG